SAPNASPLRSSSLTISPSGTWVDPLNAICSRKWASPRWSSASAKLPTSKRRRITTLSFGVVLRSSAYFIPFGSTPKTMFGSTAMSLAAKFHARAASVCGLTAAEAAGGAPSARAKVGGARATSRRRGDSAAEARRIRRSVMRPFWPRFPARQAAEAPAARSFDERRPPPAANRGLSLFLAMAFQVEHRGISALGHQPQPPRDLLIRLDLAAEVAAEAVLVELLVRRHVPQATAIGADLVGQDDAAVVAV